MTSTLVTQIQLAYAPHSGGDDFNQGYQAGLAKGERDALNGRPFYDGCSGPSNQYCLGYKVAYGIEYRITKFLRDAR